LQEFTCTFTTCVGVHAHMIGPVLLHTAGGIVPPPTTTVSVDTHPLSETVTIYVPAAFTIGFAVFPPETIWPPFIVVQLNVEPDTVDVACKVMADCKQPSVVSIPAFATGPGAIVTVNEHVDVLLHASVAVTVTVVVPIGNTLPEGIEKTGVAGLQLSVTVAE
jgi:hypothetical protein